jgi:hypothetical protein
MNTTVAEILDRAKTLAKSDRNLDMMDRVTLLHGYLGLSTLHPEDSTFQKDVDNAVTGLLEAASRHEHWRVLVEPEDSKTEVKVA